MEIEMRKLILKTLKFRKNWKQNTRSTLKYSS